MPYKYKFSTKQERQVRTAGCLIGFFWLVSVALSLALTGSVIALVVAAAYFVCTGEFILR